MTPNNPDGVFQGSRSTAAPMPAASRSAGLSLDTDIEVLRARPTFVPVQLDAPLVISGRAIDWFTLAIVTVDVRNRRGDTAEGRGASMLSVPWAWPRADTSVEHRDQLLRGLTGQLADQVCGRPPTDPIDSWLELHRGLADTAKAVANGALEVPPLAALLALGSVDNAIHDGWARAAGRPAHTMYNGNYLHDDLGAIFGPELDGRWPGDFLTAPRSRLEVQHVVGIGDPLEPADAGPGERSLREWLMTDRAQHIKIKVSGSDVAEDARQIAAVHRVGLDVGIDASLAVDPNEGYADIAEVVALLDRLQSDDPRAYGAIAYIEQPVARDSRPDAGDLARLGSRIPVIMDEGLADPLASAHLGAEGWSGIVIKAAKGHSAALLAHAAATAAGLYVTVQDLTAVDLALLHSARLASQLALSSPHLECNSRQYAPGANRELAAKWPELTTVRDGTVSLPPPQMGLY